MLEIKDSDRPIIYAVMDRAFATPGEVIAFVNRIPVCASVRGQTVSNPTQAVNALVESSVVANELQVVLTSRARELARRDDIRQLILELSNRQGWDYETVELTPKSTDLIFSGLEGLRENNDPFVDPLRLKNCLDQSLRGVCFIRRRSDKQQLGTGFLVARNQILTCYHVVEHNLAGTKDQDHTLRVNNLEAVFDFSTNDGGNTPDQKSLTGVAIDGTIDSPFAPYSTTDLDLNGVPGPEELDFALLTLTSARDERGYFEISQNARIPDKHAPVIIAQHPGDPPPPESPTALLPLKVSFAQPGIIGLEGNGTRLVYYNDTIRGASGSPVFDRDGTVIAIHHNRGQFADARQVHVKNNRGVPIDRIVSLLKQRHGWPSTNGQAGPAAGEGLATTPTVPARPEASTPALPSDPPPPEPTPADKRTDSGRLPYSFILVASAVVGILVVIALLVWGRRKDVPVAIEIAKQARPLDAGAIGADVFGTLKSKYLTHVYVVVTDTFTREVNEPEFTLNSTTAGTRLEVRAVVENAETGQPAGNVIVRPAGTASETVQLQPESGSIKAHERMRMLVGIAWDGTAPSEPLPGVKEKFKLGRIGK